MTLAIRISYLKGILLIIVYLQLLAKCKSEGDAATSVSSLANLFWTEGKYDVKEHPGLTTVALFVVSRGIVLGVYR